MFYNSEPFILLLANIVHKITFHISTCRIALLYLEDNLQKLDFLFPIQNGICAFTRVHF